MQVVYLGGVVDTACTIRSSFRNEGLIAHLLGVLCLRALGCQPSQGGLSYKQPPSSRSHPLPGVLTSND